jgi:hypothetical protein
MREGGRSEVKEAEMAREKGGRSGAKEARMAREKGRGGTEGARDGEGRMRWLRV